MGHVSVIGNQSTARWYDAARIHTKQTTILVLEQPILMYYCFYITVIYHYNNHFY